jgi:hypothetical protein
MSCSDFGIQIIPHVALYVIMETQEISQQKMEPPFFFLPKMMINAVEKSGADGGGRTHTSSRILDFESSASANSATSATAPIYFSGGQSKSISARGMICLKSFLRFQLLK